MIGLAPGPAAGAVEDAVAVADRPSAQRDERRQVPVAAMAGHDRAEVGRIDLRRRGARRAGQRDRAGLAVSGVEIDVRADQGEPVAPLRQLRHQLGEAEARRLRRDRRERPAELGRRMGLGVEEVEVARPAPEPDQQDRSRPARGGSLTRRRGPRGGIQPEGDRRGCAEAEELASRRALACPCRKPADRDHCGCSLSCRATTRPLATPGTTRSG